MGQIIVFIVGIVAIIAAIGNCSEKEKTPAQLAAEAAQAAENRERGFHCLSTWDGSHRGLALAIKEQLRDPGSFEHVSTRITPRDKDGNHVAIMEYRARNGFGGMNVAAASAMIRNSDCKATLLTVE